MVSNNKRIAKNIIFLYIRMIVTMIITLYTSRIVLSELGINDFGIYNVVAGVVSALGIISNTLSNSSLRFLSFEIGRKDEKKLKDTFSMTVSIYIFFSLLILILAETIGLWFFYNILNIPYERITAAFWTYQFSVLAFIFTILRIPYNAAIFAYEKLSFFAWSSIIEVILKLIVVFLLVWFSFDKLILYSILTCGVIGIITLVYVYFCINKFVSCKYKFLWDKSLFNSMFGFAGWSFIDSIAGVMMNQGVNILLNIFFGPIINAARAIAYQISTQVASFVYGLQGATSPQIVKYYAQNNKNELEKLYYRSSKLTFYLFFLIALPVFFEIDLLLKWWLKDIPDFSSFFTRLILINVLVDCLSGTINDVVRATGKIKLFEIFVSLALLLNLPMSYIFLKIGFGPEITMFISIIVSFISLFVRLFIAEKITGFRAIDYLKNVTLKNLMITLISSIVPTIIYYNYYNESFAFFVFITMVCAMSTILAIYFVGFEIDEKNIIKKTISKLIPNYKKTLE